MVRWNLLRSPKLAPVVGLDARGAATANPRRREALLDRMMKVIVVRSDSQRRTSIRCNLRLSANSSSAASADEEGPNDDDRYHRVEHCPGGGAAGFTHDNEERFSLGGAAPRPVRGGSAAGSRAGERKTYWANPPAPQPWPSPSDASRDVPWS
jgi:hypothetical protein